MNYINVQVIAGPQIYDSTSRQDDDESLKHMLYMSRGTSDHFLLVAGKASDESSS